VEDRRPREAPDFPREPFTREHAGYATMMSL
jgi:hypothetical protein